MSETQSEKEPFFSERVEPAGGLIKTSEQAVRWVEELLRMTEEARTRCDFAVNKGQMIALGFNWIGTMGQALGVLAAYGRSGLINDVAWAKLRNKVLDTKRPTIIQQTPGGDPFK